MLRNLASEFSIVTYDKRGHGLSDLGVTPYTIQTHVADLAGLLENLGVRQSIICGLSVGGLIAQGLYATYPDHVRAMILCDTASKIGRRCDMERAYRGHRTGRHRKHFRRDLVPLVYAWLSATRQTRPFAGSRNMLVRQSAAGYIATCSAIRDADLTTAAGKISSPNALHRWRLRWSYTTRTRRGTGTEHPQSTL